MATAVMSGGASLVYSLAPLYGGFAVFQAPALFRTSVWVGIVFAVNIAWSYVADPNFRMPVWPMPQAPWSQEALILVGIAGLVVGLTAAIRKKRERAYRLPLPRWLIRPPSVHGTVRKAAIACAGILLLLAVLALAAFVVPSGGVFT